MDILMRRVCSGVTRHVTGFRGPGRFLITQQFLNGKGSRKYSDTPRESVFEPSYLDNVGLTVPDYELVNVQLKGYDFPVLESYGKFVHNTAHRFGIDVEDGWGTPCKKLKVTALKPESSVVESEYALNVYERNVQLADVPSTILPMFINFIEAAVPSGVTLNVHLHEPEHTEVRYIPDYQLEDLKSELETMRSAREKK